MRTRLMAGYSKIKPDLVLNPDVNTQLSVMTPMCRIITAPSTTERLVKFLGGAVDRSEADWQSPVLYACLCAKGVVLKGADLRSQRTEIAIPIPKTC
jgi:hypothetical protein